MARRPYHKIPDRAVPRLVRRPSLSMADLAASTDIADRQKSASVRLVDTREMRAPVGLKGFKVMRGDTLTAENTHQHSVRIFYASDAEEGLTPDSRVVVDCTCPRHAFLYEVANSRVGASFIYRSNGDRPKMTNPGMRVGLCKHSYRLMAYLLRQAGRRRVPGEAAAARQRAANAVADLARAVTRRR